MAGSSADIGIRIFVDNAASGALGAISQQLRGIGSSTSLASMAFGQLGATIASGVFLGALGVFALFTAALIYAVVQASNLQQAMDKVRLATGLTAAQMKDLTPWLVNLGATSIFSITQLADAVAILGQNGFKTEGQIKLMASAGINLAEATGSSATDAFKLLSVVMQAWGINASQASKVSDLLFYSFEHGTPDIAGMVSALGRLGGAARILNVPLDAMIPILDTIAQQLGSTSVAGNALVYFLTRVASPTAAGTLELKALGVSAFDSQGKFVGINNVLDQFYAKLSNLTPAKQAIAITDMFGVRGSQAVKAVMTGFANYEKQVADLKKSHDAAGSAAAGAALRMAEFGNQLHILGSNISDAAAFIGTTFIPMLSLIMSKVNPAIAAFRIWAQTNGDLAGKFGLLTGASAGIIAVIAGILILSTPMLIVIGIIIATIAAIAGLVAAIMFLPKWLGEASAQATPLGFVLRALQKVGMDLAGFINSTFKSAWKEIQPALADTWKQLQILGVELKPLLPILGMLAALIAGVVVGVLHGLVAVLGSLIVGFAHVLQGVTSMVLGIVQIVKSMGEIIDGLVSGNGVKVNAAFAHMWEGVKNLFGGALTTIMGLAQMIFGSILAFIGGFINGVYQFFMMLYNRLVGHSLIPDMLNAIKNVFSSVLGIILNIVFGWVNSIVSRVIQLGVSVINSISNAWNNARNVVANALNSIVNTVAGGFANVIGRVINAGFSIANAISNAWNNARNATFNGINGIVGAAASLGGRILGAIGWIAGAVFNVGLSIVNGIANGIRAGIGNVVGAISSVTSFIASHLPNSPAAKMGPLVGLDSAAYNIVERIADGIKLGKPLITDAMGGALGGIVPSARMTGSGVYGAGGGGGAAGGMAPTIIQLDGKVIFDNTMSRMTGQMALNGAGRVFR